MIDISLYRKEISRSLPHGLFYVSDIRFTAGPISLIERYLDFLVIETAKKPLFQIAEAMRRQE
jgi:hypothetical protein